MRKILSVTGAVLSPLAGIAVCLAGALTARGVEVPFTERVISTTADGAFSVFATDVDGDGDIDVLSASWLDDKIAWYESDGGSPPTFTERVISSTAVGAVSVFATDVDGDGDTDVLSASFWNNNIAWYENDGGSPPTFTERVISTTDGPVSVFATDLDGDGDTDVLSASVDDDKIAWYENDGGSPPTFTVRVISTAADFARSVFATDVDGDGDTDVLSASADGKIAWYENDGGSPPTFTERVIPTAADWAISVFATDVDGDGDIDVLSASERDNKIAWYENTTPLPIYYVDDDATGANDGSSWCDAFIFLQDALAAAQAANGDADPGNDIAEIRVAQGTYTPDRDSTNPGGTGDRTATFQLLNGVALKGGYAGGCGLPSANDRDFSLYETILSGDLAGDDVPVPCPQNSCVPFGRLCVDGFCNIRDNNAENSLHVVTGSETDATAVVDGFTIRAGNANGASPDDLGGGMYNSGGSPTVTTCTFTGNSANLRGGGMYNGGGSPTVTNCLFTGNGATVPPFFNSNWDGGGGMYNLSSTPMVTNCTFNDNWGSHGGGMYNRNLGLSGAAVVNCIFSGNAAGGQGGGDA